MKKLLIILLMCFIGSNMLFSQGTIIYKNTFAGDAGSSPTATTPEISTIIGFSNNATTNITLDGSGKLQQSGNLAGIESYQFRLNSTPLNEIAGLNGVKATIVMRTPKSDWVAFCFGADHTAFMRPNPAGLKNTWVNMTATNTTVWGGEGAINSSIAYATQKANDTLTVEYIYRFDKKVTLVSNGDTIASGLSITHTQGGVEADPVIQWFMLTFWKQPTIADGGAYIDELTIETLGSGIIRHIDLSVDQTGWENCITTVRNDFMVQQINVFPNPGDGVFKMNVAGFSSGESLNLKVVDSQGRIIQTRDERLCGEGLHNFRIDLSDQSAGIYFIILMNNKNKMYSCKIIKN